MCLHKKGQYKRSRYCKVRDRVKEKHSARYKEKKKNDEINKTKTKHKIGKQNKGSEVLFGLNFDAV